MSQTKQKMHSVFVHLPRGLWSRLLPTLNCYQSCKAQTRVSWLVPLTASPWASLPLSHSFALSWGPALLLDLFVWVCSPHLHLPGLLTHPDETQQSDSYSSDLGPLSGQFNIGVVRCWALFPSWTVPHSRHLVTNRSAGAIVRAAALQSP